MKSEVIIASMLLAVSLCGCGNTYQHIDAIPLSGEAHLDITNPNVDRMHLFANDGTAITVLCPQNYDCVELASEYKAYRFLEKDFESEGNAYVTYAIIPSTDIGEVLANPLAAVTDDVTIANNEISDIVGYITGNETLVGLESVPTVDLSKYNTGLPKIYLPEISYVFQLPNKDYLLLRVSLDTESIEETINIMEELSKNAYSEVQVSEELQNSEITKVSLEQAAVLFMERTFVGNY